MIKRYSLIPVSQEETEMLEREDGEWVDYIEYAVLQDKYEKLRIKLSWIENPDRMGQ